MEAAHAPPGFNLYPGTQSESLTLCAPLTHRESTSMVKIFRNFKEVLTVKPPFATERIFGGALLAIAGADFICFYGWNQGKVRRRLASPCTEPPHCGWWPDDEALFRSARIIDTHPRWPVYSPPTAAGSG